MSYTNDIMKLINKLALGGRKIPHGVSNLVFRRDENGKIVVAAFIYTYNAEELRSRKIKRPSHWITIDIKNGNAVCEYNCAEDDFCNIPMDSVCDLNAESDIKFSTEYTKQTLAVFDLILRKYQITGIFDEELNDAYMFMMLRMASVGFKEIYRQLNNTGSRS